MPPSRDVPRERRNGRKRAANACYRCRQQKIRCSARQPCDQCSKRNLSCNFGDKGQKVMVSREFLDDLERRASALAHNVAGDPQSQSLFAIAPDIDTETDVFVSDSNGLSTGVSLTPHLRTQAEETDDLTSSSHATPVTIAEGTRPVSTRGQLSSSAVHVDPSEHLTNPFSCDTTRYFSDRSGRSWYIGTSSNWAFNLQVLSIARKQLTGQSVPDDGSAPDGDTYDVEWVEPMDMKHSDDIALPSPDYAIYLINAVKFHCGQIFHLFEEASFMHEFRIFQQNPINNTRSQQLWYVHFLVLLAFGKVFVARRSDTRQPPGIDYFVHAMRLLPNIIVLSRKPSDAVELLCCMALYLQCLDFRSSAYNMIGQALRIALNEGMHTSMQDQSLDAAFVRRCHSIWWTVYILDRQMSSVLGLPIAIHDDEIRARLPTTPLQSSSALGIHVKLSRILSQILNTVYGTEGRLSRRFIDHTQNALKEIATVTDELKTSFAIPLTGTAHGISRLSAYLHLLHDQCVILATRPLLFSFLKTSLDHPSRARMAASSGSARVLLKMCVESSQHTLGVLDRLRDQDLLESFLPFDLNAVFAAGMIIILTTVVDRALLPHPSPWLEMAFTIVQEMVNQGNRPALARKKELENLQQLFSQQSNSASCRDDLHNPIDTRVSVAPGQDIGNATSGMTSSRTVTDHRQYASDHTVYGEYPWGNELTADHLIMVADSLDLDGIDWITTMSSNNTN